MNKYNIEILFAVFGIITLTISLLFMHNSTYNGTLVDKGILEYNKTTGKLIFSKEAIRISNEKMQNMSK